MSEIQVDTVAEKTSANGVTVDGLNIKDSKLVTANSVIGSNITADAVDATKIADDAISEEHLDVTAITGHDALTSVADDDLVLLSDTSASAALKKMTVANLVANAGGGKIGQVVSSGAINQAYTSNATSYTLVTNHTLAITPSATSSKILMFFSFAQRSSGTANTFFSLFNGSTNLGPADGLFISQEGLGDDVEVQCTLQFLDSPSSTSAVTYGLFAKSAGSGDSAKVNFKGSDSVITLMEVLA